MIELQQISRVFQVGGEEVHALDDVSLTIRAGEYLSLMGPSGSGKSTLLNIVGLLDRPSSGRYVLDGRDTTLLDEHEQAAVRGRKVGFVFQSFHLVPRLSAFENVELPLLLAGVAATQRRERVDAALAAMGLADRANHRPDQLSGGQRQRIAIARATIMRPAVLLADEPTGNLDSTSGAEVIAVLEQLCVEGLTLVVVTHDADVGQRASRRLRMVDGRIVADTSGRQQ
ncbi:MAG: ABC transporter ATP-binding protein [Chromatiales bacterium]|nr:ABC transporter ATP-binding protein [Chromatiales bacterium]MDH3945631.1 ABC transporter ATP-binding protein [Chromatiales bacterium]MDH4014209.1 ABC transporter ATP-binding protein [Chromatiales bacterium]